MYTVEVKKITNSNKFRQAAISFQKNGYYTPHPRGTTAYIKYWDEETNRCLEGYNSEDGDYISGYNYFYLNYSPILKVEESEIERNGKKVKKSERIRNFPDFWDYDKAFFDAVEEAEREGKHLTFLKPRGIGASFKGSSMLTRNYFLIPESTSLAITEEMESLTKDGILTKAWDIVDFINEHTAWTKKSQKVNTKLHKRASLLLDNGVTQLEVGYKSEIIGLSVKNNPDKPRGKRFKLCVIDEVGLITNPIHLYSSLRHGAEEDGSAFGLIILQGTGGKREADYSEMRKLYYEPDVYNFLECNNIWDEGKAGTACGFFWPRYYNIRGFMDEDGNSLVQAAKKREQEERERIILRASDKNQIDTYCAERPFSPEESLLQVSGNIFPKKELLNHLGYIQNNETIRSYKQVGDLMFGPTGVLQWVQQDKPRDITSYRLGRSDNKEGAIVIWEHPEPNPPWGLYLAGCDPYDHSQAESSDSLGSVFIYKGFHSLGKTSDTIVAEYTGRPNSADEFYENVRKLLLYYNATCLYENQWPGLSVYMRNKHSDYILADQPSIISKIINDSKVNRGKGIHMTNQIKDWSELRIRDWLIEEYEPGKLNLTKILSEALLEELVAYNGEVNTDRVIALMMIMIFKEELHELHTRRRDETIKTKRLFESPVFDTNRDFYTFN
jgi:hypothetical protein